MTTYFDDVDKSIFNASQLEYPDNVDTLRAIEASIVFDVSVCIMMQGFPEDLRDEASHVMFEHCVENRTVNDSDNPRVDSVRDHFREIEDLSSKLHTCFHRVVIEHEAQGKFDGKPFRFSDNPRSPLRQLASRAEELREVMAEARKTAKP